MDLYQLGIAVAEAAVYILAGIVMLGAAFLLLRLFVPFRLKKEIEEEQNVSLAILFGALILGAAIIIAAVLSTPLSSSFIRTGADVTAEKKMDVPAGR